MEKTLFDLTEISQEQQEKEIEEARGRYVCRHGETFIVRNESGLLNG